MAGIVSLQLGKCNWVIINHITSSQKHRVPIIAFGGHYRFLSNYESAFEDKNLHPFLSTSVENALNGLIEALSRAFLPSETHFCEF